jgi:type IV secretory pathway VirB6-like protein
MNRFIVPTLKYILTAFIVWGGLTIPAYAADQCTTSPMYQPQNTQNGGVINTMVDLVEKKSMKLTEKLYEAFVKDSGYTAIFYALLTLYIIIYGVMIMFNMASTQPYEVMKKIIKIAILSMFISPTSWDFFNTNVVAATWGTMNELISLFGQIATGDNWASPDGTIAKTPLLLVNAAFQMVFSLKFFVMILSTTFTSIAGPVFAFMLVLCGIGIIRSVIGAVVTYFKVMIALSFLLGMAPLFIPFALFAETKKIFQGWLQQVIGLVLQPIMLFAFLSFFLVMIANTINALLGQSDYCWVATDFVNGAPQQLPFFRPQVGGQTGLGEGRSDGWFTTLPINTNDIIMLLVLSELAWRYSKYVADVAKDFGGGALNLATTGGDMKNMFGGNLAKDNTEDMFKEMKGAAKDSHDKYKESLEGTGSREEALLKRNTALAEGLSGESKGKSSLKALKKDWRNAEIPVQADGASRLSIGGSIVDLFFGKSKEKDEESVDDKIKDLKEKIKNEKDPKKKEALGQQLKAAEKEKKELEQKKKKKEEEEKKKEKQKTDEKNKEEEKRKQEEEKKKKEEGKLPEDRNSDGSPKA